MPVTYLDANATEPIRPTVVAAVVAALQQVGNPSSVHAAGRAGRRLLEDARERLAARFGARPAELVFTSGATEADAWAVQALGRDRRVIVGATEHDAVRAAAPDGATLPVDGAGVADLDALRRMLASGGPALVCLMLANNETGVIQPVAAAGALCRAAGALLVGPRAADMLAPLIAGGGQERGRRGGTPALPAIAGFAAAADAAADWAADLAPLRDALERTARRVGATVIGAAAPRLANTACLALPGVRAETQVIALDLEGVQVSAGAACSSGKVARSHVLDAMGLGALAGQAIRVSLPWSATDADVAAFAVAYQKVAARLSRDAA